MKKINFTILGCAVCLSLFSGCSEISNDKCCESCSENKIEKNIVDTKEEVKMITTDSGLKYEIITQGKSSVMPKKGQKVTVHYTGWLDENGQNGVKFDSSVDRGNPFTFVIGVGQVIKGWDEGVVSMKVGEKRRLIIPSNLGYGPYGAGSVIPANATLIFEVELLEVA
ncbi:MAG: FKBP-type peptidyl-prolyl cis-trans isomerase [bacterium]